MTSRLVPFKCGSCLIDSCHRCEAQSCNSNALSITGASLSEGVKCAGFVFEHCVGLNESCLDCDLHDGH